jgi:hypothetical protein
MPLALMADALERTRHGKQQYHRKLLPRVRDFSVEVETTYVATFQSHLRRTAP